MTEAQLQIVANDAVGEWWEPIRCAPRNGVRLLLAFPRVERPRLPGEKGGAGNKHTYIRHAGSAFGWWIPPEKASWEVSPDGEGYWSPDYKGRSAFPVKPTHWMREPELPDEYQN
jgi:hypothetical protein